ncbi:P-loop containing nucleoside triphosphate hydrolase [Lasallia pustulata]|uniref:p-loop containing nucleoside triphosphate hydrolase n=1 Tax=Lasallia pustulata TaxID=136370 RepID=A0A1W5CS92_9LECA|nr:P-loop containing nucleoside triphosphate hydrolase [Lasallia pustulata]
MEVVLMLYELEFVVDDIEDIVWNPSSFDNLSIPAAKKKVITGLAKAHMSRASDDVIDDFVEGKGQGLITLLHGPPGVGQTLTAEGLSEYLERPLYAISAGELGQDAKILEDQLSTIFRLAHHWKALVLLGEADVFVQSRSFVNPHNVLVSVFLRKLEYFRGTMILTANHVKDIDDAIQSRISVALHYGPLGFSTRKAIWKSFLKKAATAKGRASYYPADLDWLSRKEVNGRQIKNMITTAHTLAMSEMKPLSRLHLEVIIGLDEEFHDFGPLWLRPRHLV